jgi:hypothetical protein
MYKILLSLVGFVALAAAYPETEFVAQLSGMNNDQDLPYPLYSGYVNIADGIQSIHYVAALS